MNEQHRENKNFAFSLSRIYIFIFFFILFIQSFFPKEMSPKKVRNKHSERTIRICQCHAFFQILVQTLTGLKWKKLETDFNIWASPVVLFLFPKLHLMIPRWSLFFLSFVLSIKFLFSLKNRRQKVKDIHIDAGMFLFDDLSAEGTGCFWIELAKALLAECVMVDADDVGLRRWRLLFIEQI